MDGGTAAEASSGGSQGPRRTLGGLPIREVTAVVSTALSRRLKLAAPVLAVGVVAAGVTVPRLADAADTSAALPPRTAAQLLEDVSQAEVDGLSGTVVATSRLGLPELPSTGEGGSAVSLTGLLSGSTTARVWKAGDDRSRVAVDAPFAEYDVVRDGSEVWTYDSASSDVTHLVLPEGVEQQSPAPEPSGTATPQDVAERLLSFVEPTTTVTVGSAEEVAGRAAYELVLEPKDELTLVDEVRLAVDGETSVPLRVQAFGVGQTEPAVEVAFTSVRFAVPDASVFDFTPPSGSTVTERSLEDVAGAAGTPDPTAPKPSALPQVLGEGWSTVVETSGVQLPESAQGLFGQLSTPAKGGRAITSALVSVLLTDDGRMLVGAVPTSELEALAAQ